MNLPRIGTQLLRIPYLTLRTTLAHVESEIVSALDPCAPARMEYEKLIERVDDFFGTILDDSNACARASLRREHLALRHLQVAQARRFRDARLAAEGRARMERYRRHRQPDTASDRDVRGRGAVVESIGALRPATRATGDAAGHRSPPPTGAEPAFRQAESVVAQRNYTS